MIGRDVLTLIGTETTGKDSLGQHIETPVTREVFARIESVSQSEFFEAARIGLTPSYKAVLSFAEDYGGEEIAEYNGQRYAIYRTFVTAAGQIELYLKRETGVR